MANYCFIQIQEALFTPTFVAPIPTIPTVEIALGLRTSLPVMGDFPTITLGLTAQTPTPETTGGSSRPTTGQIWPRSIK